MIIRNTDYPVKVYDEETEQLLACALFKILHHAKKNCVSCGKALDSNSPVDLYEHDGGWTVIKSWPKQWVSVHCNHCGYDNSISKLGVSR